MVGGGTFDSVGVSGGGTPAAAPFATPAEADEPEPFVQPLAPLPEATRQEERRGGASLAAWGVAGGLGLAVALVAVGVVVAWLLFVPTPGPLLPPVVVAVPPVPVLEAPALADWPGAQSARRAHQALLDGDAFRAQEQAGYVVAGAPVEDPQLVIIAARAARSELSSVWEEVERGRHFGLDPIQGRLADALGDPDGHDAELIAHGHPAALYARIRMGPRHAARDADLLGALWIGVGDRRLVDLARARVAEEAGSEDGGRPHLDRALEGGDVPELVRARDALWYLNHGQPEAAAASIDAVIDAVERPSFFTWMVRAEVDVRLGRAVRAAESSRKVGGPATLRSLRRMLRADGLLMDGEVAAGLEEALAAEADLKRYEGSKEVNAVRLDVLTEVARLGALAKDRATVVEALARLQALIPLQQPPARQGTAEVRVALVEAMLQQLDGRSGPVQVLREVLEERDVGSALERRVLDDIEARAPLRVHPTQLP